jgi:hypothetical protein
LDRALVFGTSCRGFESLTARHNFNCKDYERIGNKALSQAGYTELVFIFVMMGFLLIFAFVAVFVFFRQYRIEQRMKVERTARKQQTTAPGQDFLNNQDDARPPGA